MINIYYLYCEMIEEKGDEELDQHWSMVFAGKIEKGFLKEINDLQKQVVRDSASYQILNRLKECVNDNTHENYSQLPKDLCVKGKEARRYSSERLSEFTTRPVELPADANDLCECGHGKEEHCDDFGIGECSISTCSCKKFVKHSKGVKE